MGRVKDISGKPFGYLIPDKPVGRDKNGGAIWRCRCTCGKNYNAPASQLRSCAINSCGCQPKETKQSRRNRLQVMAMEEQEMKKSKLPLHINEFVQKYKHKKHTHRTHMIMKFIEQATCRMGPNYKRKQRQNNSSIGCVYAIHVPSFGAKGHLKIGWSSDAKKRLRQHLCTVPDCKIVSIWVTSHEWLERFALRWANAQGNRVYGEVFAFDDIDAAITELNAIFAELGIAASRPGGGEDVRDWLKRSA